jgi:asparagine N-glycosylation enzyme membrane subunit Stt3
VRTGFLFFVEVFTLSALILLTRCANYRDVFVGEQIYFVDADCYARMTRARICFEHPGTIVRHQDFENFPAGISPHTTAPLDYLIVGLAALLTPFSRNALEVAGAIVSPFIALALAILLCWWTRRMSMRFRFGLLILYAISPILAHGTALGRPDHQSLLIALIAVGLCAEWTLAVLKGRAPRDPSASQSSALQRSARRWGVLSGASWGLAIWVSLYEPAILFFLVLITLLVTGQK